MRLDHHKGIPPRDNHKGAIHHHNNNSNNPTRIDNDNDPSKVGPEHDHNKGIRHSNRKTNARGRVWAVAVDGIRNNNNDR